MPQPAYICDLKGCAAIADMSVTVASLTLAADPNVMSFAASFRAPITIAGIPAGSKLEYFCGQAHRLKRLSQVTP